MRARNKRRKHNSYLLDTLNVAKRNFELDNKIARHKKKLHISRLDKLIAALEQYAAEYKICDLPETPLEYEKVLIDTWEQEGFSDREITEILQVL